MKRILSLFLTILMLFSICICPVTAADTLNESDTPMAEDIDVSAYAAIVVDMETGKVLYEHDADEKNYPASTTKIMTAYLALKYGNPDDMITVSSSAFSNLSQMASTWNTKVGEEMSVYRTLQALLVVSASECANVLGEYISGSHEEFVNLMNEEAQALGCTNTHFVNCHGLPRSEHYTTARDLATIAMAAMEYDVFREIVGSAVTVLEPTNIHGSQSITSTNGILPGSSYPNYNYPYAIGIKTGHASTAGYVLVSAANKDGKELLCVVMGCVTREGSFAQTIKLYDWAYENYDILTWGWETDDTETGDAQEIPDAPEYEEVASATSDEEEVILVEELGEPLSEDSSAEAVSEEPVSEAASEEATTSAPESGESDADTTAIDSTGTASSASVLGILSLEDLSSAMLPALLCFGVAIILLLVLVIILIVILSRRKKKKKAKKSAKRKKSKK